MYGDGRGAQPDHGVIGVAKAYITRVGGGPFPTEALDGAGERIRDRGKEFGAVTGRPRRCGWFDAPLMRYTAVINGFDSIVVTKLDVLDEIDKIPVCVGYRIGGREVTEMPPTVREVEKIEPVYECMPGWSESTFGISSYDELAREGERLSRVSRRTLRRSRRVASPQVRSAIRQSCVKVRGWKG